MKDVILIGGPTASGKSKIAIEVAQKLSKTVSVDIINADSIQVYDELKILSSQPSDFQKNLFSHKLYGFYSSKESCSVWIWKEYAEKSIKSSWENGRLPILVGGTGLYLKSLVEGLIEIPRIKEQVKLEAKTITQKYGLKKLYEDLIEKDPSAGANLNYNDNYRVTRAWEVLASTGKSINYWQTFRDNLSIKAKWHGFSILPERAILYENINQRFLNMIDSGVIDEVKEFMNKNQDVSLPCAKAVGFRQLCDFINKVHTLEESIELAQQTTRRLAKRQYTWFRNQMSGFAILDDEIDSNINKIFNIIKRFY